MIDYTVHNYIINTSVNHFHMTCKNVYVYALFFWVNGVFLTLSTLASRLDLSYANTVNFCTVANVFSSACFVGQLLRSTNASVASEK